MAKAKEKKETKSTKKVDNPVVEAPVQSTQEESKGDDPIEATVEAPKEEKPAKKEKKSDECVHAVTKTVNVGGRAMQQCVVCGTRL